VAQAVENEAQAMQKVYERAWNDAEFERRLLEQPRTVLAENGIQLPEGVQVQVHKSTANEWDFVLPEKDTVDLEALKKDGPYAAMVIGRAWDDPEFKQRLIENPAAAFTDLTGLQPPAHVHIDVFENTPDTIHFIMPARPTASDELSDADLEAVAGGKGSPNRGGCGTARQIGKGLLDAGSAVGGKGGAVVAIGGGLTWLGATIASAAK
jgi:hypothetical protein